MTDTIRRFTDAHVLADPALRELAESYARQYVGAFEEMLGARRIVMHGGELNTSQVRMVLNTMLTSTQVKNMPQPPETSTFDAGLYRARQRTHRPAQTRRWPFELKAVVRKPYIYSTNPRAFNIHVIKFVKVKYFPAMTQELYHNRFSCTIHCWCPEQWSGGRNYLRIADKPEVEKLIDESGRRWCKTCLVGCDASQ